MSRQDSTTAIIYETGGFVSELARLSTHKLLHFDRRKSKHFNGFPVYSLPFMLIL